MAYGKTASPCSVRRIGIKRHGGIWHGISNAGNDGIKQQRHENNHQRHQMLWRHRAATRKHMASIAAADINEKAA